VLAELALSVPQAVAGLPLATNVTVSPETGVPELATVDVIVDVATPLAGTAAGAAVTVLVFGTLVWVMVVEPLRPFWASLAVMVQVPTVVLAV
jgi:hypothetical protein